MYVQYKHMYIYIHYMFCCFVFQREKEGEREREKARETKRELRDACLLGSNKCSMSAMRAGHCQCCISHTLKKLRDKRRSTKF